MHCVTHLYYFLWMVVFLRASHKWECPMPTNRLPYCALCDSMIPVRDTREFHKECRCWKDVSLFTRELTDDGGGGVIPLRLHLEASRWWKWHGWRHLLPLNHLSSSVPAISLCFEPSRILDTLSLCHFHSLDVAKRWAKISMLENPSQHFARNALFITHTISPVIGARRTWIEESHFMQNYSILNPHLQSFQLLGESEIGHFDVSFPREHQILRFQISIHLQICWSQRVLKERREDSNWSTMWFTSFLFVPDEKELTPSYLLEEMKKEGGATSFPFYLSRGMSTLLTGWLKSCREVNEIRFLLVLPSSEWSESNRNWEGPSEPHRRPSHSIPPPSQLPIGSTIEGDDPFSLSVPPLILIRVFLPPSLSFHFLFEPNDRKWFTFVRWLITEVIEKGDREERGKGGGRREGGVEKE